MLAARRVTLASMMLAASVGAQRRGLGYYNRACENFAGCRVVLPRPEHDEQQLHWEVRWLWHQLHAEGYAVPKMCKALHKLDPVLKNLHAEIFPAHAQHGVLCPTGPDAASASNKRHGMASDSDDDAPGHTYTARTSVLTSLLHWSCAGLKWPREPLNRIAGAKTLRDIVDTVVKDDSVAASRVLALQLWPGRAPMMVGLVGCFVDLTDFWNLYGGHPELVAFRAWWESDFVSDAFQFRCSSLRRPTLGSFIAGILAGTRVHEFPLLNRVARGLLAQFSNLANLVVPPRLEIKASQHLIDSVKGHFMVPKYIRTVEQTLTEDGVAGQLAVGTHHLDYKDRRALRACGASAARRAVPRPHAASAPTHAPTMHHPVPKDTPLVGGRVCVRAYVCV